ncbi:hypothetical protein [Gluconobacter sp. OJB]|uniref:hypothetical protein n=1 Tax=Gluconobacter sp. OJB TaxID=3145196 RepID=UPI0031F80FBF
MLGDTIYGRLKDLQIIKSLRSSDEYYDYFVISTNRSDMSLHEKQALVCDKEQKLHLFDFNDEGYYQIIINLCNQNEFSVRKIINLSKARIPVDVSDIIFAKSENGDFIFLDHENNYRSFDKDNNPLDGQGDLEETIFYMKLKEII